MTTDSASFPLVTILAVSESSWGPCLQQKLRFDMVMMLNAWSLSGANAAGKMAAQEEI